MELGTLRRRSASVTRTVCSQNLRVEDAASPAELDGPSPLGTTGSRLRLRGCNHQLLASRLLRSRTFGCVAVDRFTITPGDSLGVARGERFGVEPLTGR